ncbi:hypothetical protein ACFQ14_05105 [Pseudahrensia aquimaris]|uniref:Glutamine amidotransferase domain-containing protein n=1 Tax=Pseudahrensia aquimaris TaxID=744461 RepID=A0ABW3FG78_9HYPH
MSGLEITFAPFFAWWVIALIASLAVAFALFGIFRGLKGSWIRLAAAALLGLALANPSLLQEEREPLKTVIAAVIDQSDSQKLDGRDVQTEEARKRLADLIARFPQFEFREVVAKNGGTENQDASTALFGALKSALQDVPPEQVGGAVLITDGQVHDIPETAAALGFNAPIHALITGREDERDRRLILHKAPRFGIVGEPQEIEYSVEDTNIDSGGSVDVTVSIDGEVIGVENVAPGEKATFLFDVPHGGKNVIEFEAQVVDGEITPVNNRSFAVIEGIRENLRVLLISGEPHAGERTWRNLLKSDASVDLVHFTILRPPEKQDGTPINQLSLIAFPTRELFIEKIDEFDLIIFDRYQRRGVLPVLYFDNIARYLTDGGAILIAAGPEHADFSSIHRTPLATVLPVEPTGQVIEEPFKPQVSDAGRRHPVTRDLPGMATAGSEEQPTWSRWFRTIEGTNPQGDVVMTGAQDNPLLVLNRPGEGRVAILMSDHVWLWARGFEGGGPHTQMLRRLGHWLMKEPELDEEALRASASGNTLRIERQTMGDQPGSVDIVDPTGARSTVELTQESEGLWTADFDANTLGLYRLANGDLTTLASVGPSNPREYSQIISTGENLASLAAQTRGSVRRVGPADSPDMPRIVPVRASGTAAGNDWIGLRSTGASKLVGVNQIPLFAGVLGLILLLMALAGMWAREGR